MLRQHGHAGLRQVRFLRLVEEALDQGGKPTQENLARVLTGSVRTIRSSIAARKVKSVNAATRGELRGAGRGQTYKVMIVELYLKRHTYSEIKH